jgi:hypothetical protein
VSRVHGPWTTGTPVHRGPVAIAALGKRWKGGSLAMESSAQKDDSEGAVRARREGIGGVGCFTGGGVGFYRAEARTSVFNDRR